MPTFDIVSNVDSHEVSNAVDQCMREINNRFDFKGTSSKICQEDDYIMIYGDNSFQLEQVKTILTTKLGKRNLDPQSFDFQLEEKSHSNVKQKVLIKEGISTEFGKKIIKLIKDKKLKVQASIQEKQVRVTGKKRDDLQSVISFLKESSLEQPLQYQNFRD